MLYIRVGILIAILIIGIVLSILKRTIKFALSVIVVIIIISAVTMFIVVSDINSMKKSSEEGMSYLIVSDDEAIIAFDVQNEELIQLDNAETNKLKMLIDNGEEPDKLIMIINSDGDRDLAKISEKLEELNNPSILISKIKTGEVSFYPEKISFRMIKYIPQKIINISSKINR